MLDFFAKATEAKIDVILVLAGVLFLLLAFAGQVQIGGTVVVPPARRKPVGIIGGLFVFLGITLSIAPKVSVGLQIAPLERPKYIITFYSFLKRTEYEISEDGALSRPEINKLIQVSSATMGRLPNNDSTASQIRVTIENTSSQTLRLTFDKEFFNLSIRSGEAANLAYFCCAARDEILRPRQTKEIELIYEWPSGWSSTAQDTYFSIQGFQQVKFAEWEISIPMPANLPEPGLPP